MIPLQFLDSERPHMTELQPGRYRHFKGNEYEVLGVARDSETMQEVVVYRALYGERGLSMKSLDRLGEALGLTVNMRQKQSKTQRK